MANPLATAGKNIMATQYGSQIGKFAALCSTVPTGTAGTELSGGSPAYARKAPSWGSASAGAVSASPISFDVPSAATVAGYEHYDASTAGTYLDGVGVTSQTFSSQGVYQATPTFTQP